VIVVLNLEQQAGETGGFDPADHLAMLAQHAPDLRIDVVVADRGVPAEELAGLQKLVDGTGARLVVDDVATGDGTARHDPRRLAATYARILAQPTD
jgi:2-phospho-L-lactate transferase/gluconeogenesis factor (CofD/UPF0052 family)